MFLSKIELRHNAACMPRFWERVASGYAGHEVVWSWFADSPERRRDFLYRQEGAGSQVRFYTLSMRPPLDPLGIWRIESKPFAPKIGEGDRLLFSLRANPIRRRAAGPGEGGRHDVVMDAKYRMRREGNIPPPEPELVQTQGYAWLSARANAHGFEIRPENVRVDGYRQNRLRRSNGGEMRLTTVEIEGRLMVGDPALFVETLHTGLGPAKGFGCGLMLVKRG